MPNFLYGAISMAAATAALFFLRFYRRTGDRFFLYFFASFAIESVCRVLAVIFQHSACLGHTLKQQRWNAGEHVVGYP